MTVAEKLTLIAENEPKIYGKGKADYADEFWDTLQQNGTRTDYSRCFTGWIKEMKPFFKPKYDMLVKNANNMFTYNKAIEDLPSVCEEQGITLDFKQCTNFSTAFYGSEMLRIGTVDTTAASTLAETFCNCAKLQTIDLLILKEDGSQTLSNKPFVGCSSLENITVSGTVGSSGLSFADCPGLTAASLASILTALSKDSTTASGKSITFAKANKTAIEADESALAQYNAALSAGWTIAFA